MVGLTVLSPRFAHARRATARDSLKAQGSIFFKLPPTPLKPSGAPFRTITENEYRSNGQLIFCATVHGLALHTAGDTSIPKAHQLRELLYPNQGTRWRRRTTQKSIWILESKPAWVCCDLVA
jgi:hypothetical protein